MNLFEPRSTDYRQKVLNSFARQPVTESLGMQVAELTPGRIELVMDYNPAYTQQHSFMHAGIITTGLDNAAGYAAFSLMTDDDAILTVEFKVSLLAPAQGERFRFCAEVLKPGRSLSFVEAKAYAQDQAQEKLIATMTATMMAIGGRDNIQQ